MRLSAASPGSATRLVAAERPTAAGHSSRRPRRRARAGGAHVGLGSRGDPARRDLGAPSRRTCRRTGRRGRVSRRDRGAGGGAPPRAGADAAASPRLAPRVERKSSSGGARVVARHGPPRLIRCADRLPRTPGPRGGDAGRAAARQSACGPGSQVQRDDAEHGYGARSPGPGLDRPRARRLHGGWQASRCPRQLVPAGSGAVACRESAPDRGEAADRHGSARRRDAPARRGGRARIGPGGRLAGGLVDDHQGRGAVGVRRTTTRAGNGDSHAGARHRRGHGRRRGRPAWCRRRQGSPGSPQQGGGRAGPRAARRADPGLAARVAARRRPRKA